jgi:hypothetical protein
MEDKIYYPQETQEIPFPNSETGVIAFPDNSTATADTQTPKEVKNTQFPLAIVAQQLISQSFNTVSKKILQSFEFAQSGALQIGKYINGISGDIRITPTGILARDNGGNTTFALDAETGDAFFKGTIVAGDINVIDEDGLISLAAFDSDETYNTNTFSTSSSSYVNITDSNGHNTQLVTDNLPRSVKVIILATAAVYGTQISGSGSFSGEVFVSVFVNGFGAGGDMRMRNAYNSVTGASNADITTLSTHTIVNVPAGVNTISLEMKATQLGVGNFKAAGNAFKLSYLILGR